MVEERRKKLEEEKASGRKLSPGRVGKKQVKDEEGGRRESVGKKAESWKSWEENRQRRKKLEEEKASGRKLSPGRVGKKTDKGGRSWKKGKRQEENCALEELGRKLKKRKKSEI